MVVHVVEEEEVHAVVLIYQVLIQLRVDNGWKRSSVMLVGLRGRQHQAGEGGGGGAAPQVRRRNDNNDNDGYGGQGGRGRGGGHGGGGGGKKGTRFV